VQEIVRRLLATDDIYLGGYEGWYDEGQEEFITETEAKKAEYKSVISGRPLVRYKEPSYFFRLSKWAPRVLAHIEANPQFVQPDSRRNEVLSKLRPGVEDLSISRASLTWGVPLPNDPAHVVYVWIDALSNYITALGYGGGGEAGDALFHRYWPADVHLIGKEIMWFHTVYWPAMLFALGLPAPRQVFAHGWWTSEGNKMSKTLGNFVDVGRLRQVIATYGLDTLRFYLLRAAPFGADLNWTDADLAKSHTELGNVVGNLLNRVVNMTTRTGRRRSRPSARRTTRPTPPSARRPRRSRASWPRRTTRWPSSRPPCCRSSWPARPTGTSTRRPRSSWPRTRPRPAARHGAEPVGPGGLPRARRPAPGHAGEGQGRPGAARRVDRRQDATDLLAAPLPAGHKIGEGKVLFPKVI
jgi:hypothetical protein